MTWYGEKCAQNEVLTQWCSQALQEQQLAAASALEVLPSVDVIHTSFMTTFQADLKSRPVCVWCRHVRAPLRSAERALGVTCMCLCVSPGGGCL